MTNDLDMVFWQDEEELQEENSLKLLLCCNAPQNEDWLKSQLPDFDEAGRAKNVTELRKVLKANVTIHLAIIMKKTGSSGVDKPEDMAKIIREHSPDAQIFIIVGKKDERGIEIVSEAEKYGSRCLTAEGGPIKASDILEEVTNLADKAREQIQHEEEVEIEEDKSKIVLVKGAKGGTGTTTTMAVVAQMLDKQGEEVKVYDPSKGCTYLSSSTLEKLIIDKFYLPAAGWLVTEILEDADNSNYDLYRILVVDPSAEALSKAKNEVTEEDILIINRAEPQVLPNEIYSGEFKRAPDLIVPYKPTPYLLTDWESIFVDWEPLINLLKDRR